MRAVRLVREVRLMTIKNRGDLESNFYFQDPGVILALIRTMGFSEPI